MKGKKKNGNRILPLDMSKTSSSTERKVTTNRPFLFPIHRPVRAENVLSSTQSPGPVGSKWSAKTLVFSASDLSANAQNWLQNYDAYRFRKIDVYATLNLSGAIQVTGAFGAAAVIHYCYEDIDTSASIITSWVRTMDRSNVARTVLTRTRPSAKVASFVPQPTYAASSGTSPSDLIGKEMDWVDALDLAFEWAGLRTFSYCAALQQAGVAEYDYTITYEARVSVDVRCNI